MKNKAVMKMAKMAGNNRTAMKLKAEDAAMKMKKQSAMNMGHKSSPKKHIVKVGTKKGTEAPNAAGAYTHNQAHRDKKFDINHKQIEKKDSSPKKMKKNSPMKDNHFKPEKLNQVNVTGKRTKKQKFTKAIKEKYPYLDEMKGGRTFQTSHGDFKKKKDGSVVRRDDAGRGFSTGGGFFNRLKKEGLGSALANTFPARVARSIKRGEQ